MEFGCIHFWDIAVQLFLYCKLVYFRIDERTFNIESNYSYVLQYALKETLQHTVGRKL